VASIFLVISEGGSAAAKMREGSSTAAAGSDSTVTGRKALVGDLAVRREVDADLLVPCRDPDAKDEIDDLDDHERRDRGVGEGRADGDELGRELLGIPLEQPGVGLLDGGGGEHAGRDRPEHAPDAVHGEHVQRVVDLEP
jgi:hypothetical protein